MEDSPQIFFGDLEPSMISLPSKRLENALEVIAILTVFVIVNLASQAFQKPISVNGGKGWDGVTYYAVAEHLSKAYRPKGEAPFVYRIGTPLLASLFSNALREDLILGFHTVNIVSNIITVALLALWLRLYLDNAMIRTAMVLLFVTQWHSPVRFVYFYPVYTDPWSFCFLIAGLVGIYSFRIRPTLPKMCYLALVSLAGVMFRETVLVIPIALLFSANPVIQQGDLFSQPVSLWFAKVIKKLTPMSICPLICATLGLLIVRLIALPTNDYSFLIKAFKWAYRKPILTYLTAWFITFGPLIIVAIYDWRQNVHFLRDNQYLLIYLASFAVLGWVGGTDTERILYWAMPVVYVLVGRSLQRISKLISVRLFLVLVLAQLISQRVFVTIADPAVAPIPLSRPFWSRSFAFAFLSQLTSYGNMWSYFCVPGTLFGYLLLYVSFSIVIILWLNYRAREVRSITESTG